MPEWLRPELRSVYAQPRYDELVPMGIRGKLHQLAAAKETDATDEVRSCNLFSKMLALGIVELVRTMDGNRKPDTEDSAHIKAHCCGLRTEMNVDVMKALLLHP